MYIQVHFSTLNISFVCPTCAFFVPQVCRIEEEVCPDSTLGCSVSYDNIYRMVQWQCSNLITHYLFTHPFGSFTDTLSLEG